MKARCLWRHLPGFLLPGFVIGVLAVPAFFSGCAGGGLFRESRYVPGVYEGSGRGYRGPLRVRIEVSAAGIEDITITSHQERYPGIAAMEELLEAVLEGGTTDLDAVSGASFSSRGFLEAVDRALEKARPPVPF